MLLRALYDLAVKERLFEAVHLQDRRIHLLIPIDSHGKLINDTLLPLTSKNEKGKDELGKSLSMPRFPGENNGGKAYFLAESCLGILGIDKESGEGIAMPKEKMKNPAKSFSHFWDQIQSAYATTALPELGALLQFKDHYLYVEEEKSKNRLPFIEVRESTSGKIQVGARTGKGEKDWEPLSKLTLTFQVDGNFVFDPSRDSPLNVYWKESFRREAFSVDTADEAPPNSAQRGLCLITGGTDLPIAKSHKPKILKIPGLTSGGYLVSFARECPAFSSYGLDMGENAPVSEEAAAAYALGLQRLLDDENRSLRIGPTVACFWEKSLEKESNFVVRMLRKPDPRAVGQFLQSPWAGVKRHLAKGDPFYSVVFAGNAGRVVVRHWLQTTVENARENLIKWFLDLEIIQSTSSGEKGSSKVLVAIDKPVVEGEDDNWPPLALSRLARTTVRDEKNLRGEVLTQLYRAAIEGIAPSTRLLKAILQEFRSALNKRGQDKRSAPFNPSRFALLKLILNRNRKAGDPMIQPELFETSDAAYNCGRLLAVLADAQAKAHEYGLQGPGVAERYFGMASVSPSSVFPLLIRLNRHHLDKIKKSEKFKSHANFIEGAIQKIAVLFQPDGPGQPPEFPRHLDLQKQGRFAIGFYQQKAATEVARNKAINQKTDVSGTGAKEEKA
jgi:CRISPR-associated protein Csd1